jgi:tetratricopeptide (TPR) repeat protein
MPEVVGRRRRRERRRQGRAFWEGAEWRALHALFVLAVCGSVLALGSVHPPVIIVLAVLSAAGAVLGNRLMPDRGLRLPTILLLALGGYSLLQAIPLPMALLDVLTPAGAGVWSRSLHAFDAPPPAWASLSLDPGASILEATKWATYACVFLMGAAIAAKSGARWVAATLFASGLVVALVTVAHGLADAERVYGVYEPTFSATRWRVGPLLNPNTLSGYSNLAIVAGAALLVRSDGTKHRWLLAAGVCALVACVVLAASRAGVASLLLGAVALVLVLRANAKRGAPVIGTRWLVAGVAGTFAIAVSFALLAARERTTAEILERNIEKVQMWKTIPAVVRDHPWFGIGRGAFESVFSAYRVGPEDYVYAHAENFVLQWVSEWGVPVTVAAVCAIALALRPRTLGVWRSPTAAGLWVAIIVVFVQNLADLGLEVPAVGVAVFAALGGLWGARPRRSHLSEPATWRGFVVPAVCSSIALLALAAALPGLASDKARIADAYEALDPKDAGGVDAFVASVRRAMKRHPADPYFPRVGAVALLRAGRPGSLPLIARALERGPESARNHYTLALILARYGAKEQALMELRWAATYYPGLSDRVARAALGMTQEFDPLSRVVPEGQSGALVAVALATHATGNDRSSLRERLLELATQRDPGSVATWAAAAGEWTRAMSEGRCTERRKQCEDHLAEIDRQLASVGARDPEAVMNRARIQLALGRAQEAIDVLVGECPVMPLAKRTPCVRLALQAALDSGSDDLLIKVEGKLGPIACYGPEACAQNHTWLGDQLATRKRWDGALVQYERALKELPSDERASRVAGAALQMGAYGRAVELLASLTRKDPKNAKYHQQMAQARAGLMRTPSPL